MAWKRYDEQGYVRPELLLQELPATIVLAVGGRNIGKTFGTLQYMLREDIPFIYMRTTRPELELSSEPDFNPFKKVAAANGWTVDTKMKKNMATFTITDDAAGWSRVVHGLALTDAGMVRGVSYDDVDVCFYDEFVPIAPPTKRRDNDYTLLSDFLGTANRDRELMGRAPLRVVCTGNANRIDCPIIRGAGVIGQAARLYGRESEQHVLLLPDRSMALVSYRDSELAAKMGALESAKTARGAYRDMAFANMFADMDETGVKQQPLKEYRPLFIEGEIAVWQHKAKMGLYHVTPCAMAAGAVKYQYSDLRAKKELQAIQYRVDMGRAGCTWHNLECKLYMAAECRV